MAGLAADIIQYLENRKAMPQVKERFLPDGTSGEFEYGTGLPPEGQINVQMGMNPVHQETTLTHELMHAAMRQMWHQSPDDPRLADALRKIRGGLATASSIAPQWVKDRGNYRATETEIPGWAAAFAQGRQYNAGREDPAPLHVDPTAATEISILLELANRAKPGAQK